MAWTAPMTFAPNSVLTASQLNTYLRDNMLESMPAKATTAGRFFVTTGRNQIAERSVGNQFINVSETSASLEWVDLATVGPSVTVETSARAFVMLYCGMAHSATRATWMSYEVSGATQSEPNDNRGLMTQPDTTLQRAGVIILHQDLNPGMNTFTAKYRCSVAGTGTWHNRRMAVLPL